MAGEAFFQGLHKYEFIWQYALLGGFHYAKIWEVTHPSVHFKHSQTLFLIIWYKLLGEEVCNT